MPELRGDPSSRRITLTYVRFPATTPHPGPPIVYLAGGPGVSGIETARGERFPLFMALRDVADVIALDQRGTGESNAIPSCPIAERLPLDEPATAAGMAAALERIATACESFWRGDSVRLMGYTTVASVDDLESLRRALGVAKLDLWGISYGSHLALAAVKRMPKHLGRVALASVEGLDQTVKLPSGTEAWLDRLQHAVSKDSVAASYYPDIRGLIRRVLARLDEPVRVSVDTGGGAGTFTMGADEVRYFASIFINDPENVSNLLRLFRAADRGDLPFLGKFVFRFIRKDSLRFTGMPELMDLASGIGSARLSQFEREARTATLGSMLNFPMPQLQGIIPGLDLGDNFRAPPRSNIPTLVLSGTLDGRTYPEAHRDAVRLLSNVTFVTVAGGGHNLLMTSPAVGSILQRFLQRETISDTTINVPLPSFRP